MNHHAVHYVLEGILGVALIGVIALGWHGRGELAQLEARKPVTVVQHPPAMSFGFNGTQPKPLKGTWPVLGEAKTIALGEALAKSAPAADSHLPPVQATIFCAGERCRDLMADIDDAFQIAGWTSDEDDQVVAGDEDGIMVGPPGSAATALGQAFSDAGLPVKIVKMNVRGDLGVIIGRKPVETKQ
jgi:hypothetical protein